MRLGGEMIGCVDGVFEGWEVVMSLVVSFENF
jgi:hypothetical protein